MYYFFPGTHIEELEAEKLMGGSLGVEHTHDMLVLFVNLIVGLENHPPVQRDSSLPVLYIQANQTIVILSQIYLLIRTKAKWQTAHSSQFCSGYKSFVSQDL